MLQGLEFLYVCWLWRCHWEILLPKGLDVTLKAPTITFMGTQIDLDALQSELDALETELETDEDLQNFTDQQDLARAFANAGAAATHLATQRSFSDYRLFALNVGTGFAVAAPSSSPAEIEGALEDFEDDGDAYFGAAIQPLTVGLGVNLSRWVDRLRVNAKFGYYNVTEGSLVENLAFTSMNLGVGANYQIVGTRSLAAGILRWRGVSLGSGVNYQSNRTDITVEVGEEAFSETATFDDLGIVPPSELSLLGYDADSTLGTLKVSPSFVAAVESRSVSIPLEASTGVRLLYLFDFNVGAGIDVAFGSSEVVFGAESEIDFEVADARLNDFVEVSPGSVDFGVTNEGKPQLIRPRLTAGVGLNLGPVKLDVPMMYYFDTDGRTVLVGVNLGVVW